MSNEKRSNIDNNYKWDLKKIYDSKEKLEEDINKVKNLSNKFLTYKGTILKNSNILYDSITIYYEINRILEKLIVYSNLKYHEDMQVSDSKILTTTIDKLSDEIVAKISFFIPELLKEDYKKIKQFIKENKKLKEYEFPLTEAFREKKYILDEKSEAMMARLGEVFNVSNDVFETLDVVDLKFQDLKINGKMLPLNQSNFGVYLKDHNRKIRQQAFENYYEEYIKHKNTLAATLYGNIKTNFFIANERGYKSPLQMALYNDNISETLYNNLINKVNSRIDLSYRYILLKKKILKLDELHMYDISAPLVKDNDKKYSYEAAIELVKSALAPLGEEYIDDLTKIINSNCIDVFHNENKQTGAYSWGCYDSDPYVLLNFEGTFYDASIIAHELGHSMHSYYSHKNNNYPVANYTIFLAEIASTVNEILLNKYCSEHAKTKKEKLYYLYNLLEIFRTTLIRQTMFAEFERDLYNMEQTGKILTEEVISNTYYNLNKKYYGKDIISDEQIKMEWARISHFYSGFYVYKYATGISIACRIVKDILSGKDKALENYLLFLKSGGSDYSLNILKKVGIDIENDDTIDKALDLFEETLDKFEENL